MEGYESCERYTIQEMEQCDTLGHLVMITGYIISRASCAEVQYVLYGVEQGDLREY